LQLHTLRGTDHPNTCSILPSGYYRDRDLDDRIERDVISVEDNLSKTRNYNSCLNWNNLVSDEVHEHVLFSEQLTDFDLAGHSDQPYNGFGSPQLRVADPDEDALEIHAAGYIKDWEYHFFTPDELRDKKHESEDFWADCWKGLTDHEKRTSVNQTMSLNSLYNELTWDHKPTDRSVANPSLT
jgi:hypothetical protein